MTVKFYPLDTFFDKVPIQQKAVARKAGIHPATMNNYVKGRRTVPPDAIAAINKAIEQIASSAIIARVK